MVLAIHIGNTTAKFGFLTEGGCIMGRVSIHKGMTVDDAVIQLRQIADIKGVSGSVDEAVLSSVSPALTPLYAEAVEALYDVRPLVVGPGVKTGLNIKINDPSELGADLVCMSVGVLVKYPLPSVLIHVGNATTLSYLDAAGSFTGAIITAGLRRMLDSLVSSADLLNPVVLAPPAKLFGTDSAESIRSGILYGAAAMIDGLHARICDSHPVASTVMTGDFALTVQPYCHTQMIHDELLMFDGMAAILERHKRMTKTL